MKVTCEHDEIYNIIILYVHLVTLAKEYKKWPFSGINFSGGFPDLFLEVLTGINSFLRFLYEFSKKYQIPKEKYQPVLKLFI